MSTCKAFRNKLIDFLEKQLTEQEYKKFEEHLKYCVDCQKEYASVKKLYKILDKDEVVLPGDEFFEDLKVKIRQKEIVLPKTRKAFVPKIARVLVPVLATAAVLFLFLRRPSETMEVTVPVPDLLEDKEIASYTLSKIVDEEVITVLAEIEDNLLYEIDEILDGLTDEEKAEFIKILSEKYAVET